MPKFACTKSRTPDVPMGTIIIGELIGDSIRLTQDSELRIECNPEQAKFTLQEKLPVEGNLWSWKPVNTPQKSLDRFEVAVRMLEGLNDDRNQFDPEVVKAEYDAAKTEMVIWMTYIP